MHGQAQEKRVEGSPPQNPLFLDEGRKLSRGRESATCVVTQALCPVKNERQVVSGSSELVCRFLCLHEYACFPGEKVHNVCEIFQGLHASHG